MTDGIVAAGGAGGGILIIGVQQAVYQQLVSSTTGASQPGLVAALPTIKAVNYGIAALETIVGTAGVMGKGPTKRHPSGSAGLVGVGLGSAIATYLWQV